jgi:hypothetical protein
MTHFIPPANQIARIVRRKGKHHTKAEIYVPTENYHRAIDAIASNTGVGPDEIKIALGEQANVWPDSIRQTVAQSR